MLGQVYTPYKRRAGEIYQMCHRHFSWRQALGRAKVWHKSVKENPIAERLDGESRYAKTVGRARDELRGDGKTRT